MRHLPPFVLLALSLVLRPAPLRADGANYDPLVIAATVTDFRDLEVNDAKRNRVIPIRVFLPAIKKAAPVVLYSHGLGGSRKTANYLGRQWAARGYVTVFLQHAGSDEGVWKNVRPLQMMAAMKQAANAENFRLRAGDVPAVLDQLDAWNKAVGNPLASRLDMSKIGMSGHSFGAITTQAVSGQTSALGANFTDARIKAAVVMSPSVPQGGDAKRAFGAVKIPWLLMTGTKDETVIGARASDRLLVFPALPPGQKYQVILDKAEHSAFVEQGLRGEAPRNPNHQRAILALSTAFWDAYLKGNADAKTWLDGAGPRNLLEAADVWQTK